MGWLGVCAGAAIAAFASAPALADGLVPTYPAEMHFAPEENLEQLYRYLLVKNAGLHQVHLAIGPEQGVYLTGAVPVAELDAESLDELIGEVVTRVDEIFPTAMSMGHASLYRRRPRR